MVLDIVVDKRQVFELILLVEIMYIKMILLVSLHSDAARFPFRQPVCAELSGSHS